MCVCVFGVVCVCLYVVNIRGVCACVCVTERESIKEKTMLQREIDKTFTCHIQNLTKKNLTES